MFCYTLPKTTAVLQLMINNPYRSKSVQPAASATRLGEWCTTTGSLQLHLADTRRQLLLLGERDTGVGTYTTSTSALYHDLVETLRICIAKGWMPSCGSNSNSSVWWFAISSFSEDTAVVATAAAAAASTVCKHVDKTARMWTADGEHAKSPDWCVVMSPPVGNDKRVAVVVPLLAQALAQQLCVLEPGSSLLVQLQHLDAPGMPEIVYVLSTLFEKMHVVNPASGREKEYRVPMEWEGAPSSPCCYLVCDRLSAAAADAAARKSLAHDLKGWAKYNVSSGCGGCALLVTPLSRYFFNKWEELCVMVGQQYLETMDQQIADCRHKKTMSGSGGGVSSGSRQQQHHHCTTTARKLDVSSMPAMPTHVVATTTTALSFCPPIV